jgi:tetratricopeptide (TPR) repeat protein
MLEKDLKSAVEALGPCMAGAKKLNIPELLQVAHQTNVSVLEAAGKHGESQESIQFLLKQKPDDPLQYAQLAQVRAAQGDSLGAADAWRKAIHLYEAHHDLSSAAEAHLTLANLLRYGSFANADEQLTHLEAADSLYRQLGSKEGQVNAETSLGSHYAAEKNNRKAHEFFDEALKNASAISRKDLEAGVLSQIGQAYETSGDLTQASEHYRKSADLYQQVNDLADEATQMKNLANVLDTLHKPDEALDAGLRAKAVADKSDSWLARYWVRRTLAYIYRTTLLLCLNCHSLITEGFLQAGVEMKREPHPIRFAAMIFRAMAVHFRMLSDACWKFAKLTAEQKEEI